MRTHFLLLISLFSFSLLSAQSTSISGSVTHQKEPLPKVQVIINPGALETHTDQNGNYSFSDLKPGNYTIQIRANGYSSQEKSVSLQENQILPHVNFELQEDFFQLEEIVISGTRNVIQKFNSPVIVNTISDRTFEATQSLSILEGLNFAPGLRMENNCQNCGFSQLRMNGLGGSYSQILVNSRPVFSALAGVYGLEMLPTNMVERIEVVRGGGSVLYGGNAIAGTVNIITRDPMRNSFEIGMNQSFTNFEASDRSINFNGSVVSDDLNKGITFFAYNRNRDPWDANEDGFSEITKLKNNTFGFDSYLNTSQFSKLKFGLYSINEFRRGGNNFHLKPHQTDITEQLDHKILSSNLSFEIYTPDLKQKFSVYTSAQFVDRESYYGTGGRVLSEEDVVTEEDILAINSYGNSSDASIIGGLQYNKIINSMFNLTVGTEYHFNDVLDKMPGYDRVIDQENSTLGSYAQLEINPIERLTLLLGGRYDNLYLRSEHQMNSLNIEDKQKMNVLVPRISAMFNLNATLKARASFAQGYRAPQAFDEDLHVEIVGSDVRFVKLSPDLVMEKSNSFTASMNYSKFIGRTQMNFLAEGFYIHLNNPFILSDPTTFTDKASIITKRNGEAAHFQGLNLEANISLGSQLIFQSVVTLQSAKYNKEEEIWSPEDQDDTTQATFTKKILRTPNTYGYFTLTYSPNASLSLSYSGVLTGKMHVPHVIDSNTERTVIKTTPSFFENNIKVSYDFDLDKNYKIQAFIGLQNMFNSYQKDFDIGIHRDPNYIYGPSRPNSIYIGLKMNFN